MVQNNAGRTPLHTAFSANSNLPHFLGGPSEPLLEHINADIDVADYDKIRPIHLASSFSSELTYRLLELGADTSVLTVEHQTPLMVAVRKRQCNTVGILLDHYREHNLLSLVDQVDIEGRSALHYACRSGRPGTVTLLLENGASINLKERRNLTPLYACAEYLEEQTSWYKAAPPSEPSMLEWSSYVLLTDRDRPFEPQYPGKPLHVRESIRALVAKGADTSFLMKSGHGSPISDPLTDAITKGCEAMVSELLIIQGWVSTKQ